MTDTKISVIVPVFNEPPEVLEKLGRVAELDYLAEIVISDASNDPETLSSLQMLQSVNSLVHIVQSPIPGRATQMNAGANAARHDVFWFLHADTKVPDSAPHKILQELHHARGWGRFDIRFDNPNRIMRMVSFFMNLRSATTGICTGDQAIFMHRQLFDAVGGFPKIPLMEDVEISRKLKRYSRPVRIKTPVVTSARRWEQKGYLYTIVLMWKLRFLNWVGVSPAKLAAMYESTNK